MIPTENTARKKFGQSLVYDVFARLARKIKLVLLPRPFDPADREVDSGSGLGGHGTMEQRSESSVALHSLAKRAAWNHTRKHPI
ncbi:hypothetical protein DdX_13814 [Ditylenchus destructor]|uniref:Uncharacterized protein n=1 Tax=Ditylenchus destructor TaxID=166010 RepID=A0AAD4MS43_9BILA|nr:hypothetical protein DdX_13814 [Ditylenchus destructor]